MGEIQLKWAESSKSSDLNVNEFISSDDFNPDGFTQAKINRGMKVTLQKLKFEAEYER